MKRMREKWLALPTMDWRERGQAMTELALAVIVLVMLLSIVLDLGRAFFTYLALQNAAGEGAYYGSAFPDNVGAKGTTDEDTIIYRAQNESPVTAELINWTNANFEVTYPQNGVARKGEPVKVRITYDFVFVGPLPHIFGLNQITLAAEAVQTTLASTEADRSSPAPSATPDQATAHLNDLIGTGTRTSGSNWIPNAVAWVHRIDHTYAPGILVTARWTVNGTDSVVTCTTGLSGSCRLPDPGELAGSVSSVTLTIISPPNSFGEATNPITIQPKK